ncbi:MAG: flotillin-like protein FloA [Planctomycetes bacterium]|nr:flotillin-like protein FloA [Planctomycetota bacterium]
MNPTVIVLVVLAIIVFLLFIFVVKYINLYIRALFSRANIGIFELIGMSLRKVNPKVIVDSRIRIVQSGLDISRAELEAHYLAGGNVPNVVSALIAADRAGIDLGFHQAAAIDLAGRNILEAVRTSVNPKVIDCPDASSGTRKISAVAGDGIELLAKARVTVRANLARLVGGATEETITARVQEGILTTIGSAQNHFQVLENPDLISRQVLSKGLDANTAFEILSIDIADIDVGRNIRSQLQIDQAEADKRVAQAKAEERKAMAIAREHEMVAQTQENRAKVVEAEAEIPLAIAEAFRSGNLGVMDFYRLKNIQADTAMRDSIAEGDGGEKEA